MMLMVSRLQRTAMLEGYIIPLNIIQGLPRMTISPYMYHAFQGGVSLLLTLDVGIAN